jgi:multidrug efflux system membrane fusion protein
MSLSPVNARNSLVFRRTPRIRRLQGFDGDKEGASPPTLTLHQDYNVRYQLKLSIAVLFLAALVVNTGCSSKPPAPTAEAPKITVQHPESRKLTDVDTYNGWLDANETQEVRARVRGEIIEVKFKDGDIVAEGQPLFQLDPRPFQYDRDRIEDRIKVYQAQQVAAEKELARLEELEKKGGATKRQIEKADADVKSLAAQISGTENERNSADLNLKFCEIKAAIGGKIGKAMLTKGNMVNAGGSDPLLATIVTISPVRVYFNVDERSLRRYARNIMVEGKNLTELLANLRDVNATLSFALDGEMDFSHEAKLNFADYRIDPATGTLQVYGLLDNKDGKFLAGARVRIRLPISKDYPALVVPETAILADQDKRYVLIADDENIVRRRNVSLGKLTDDAKRAIEPADKLPDGEKPANWRVLVDNLQRARLNYPIDPQKPQ